MRCRASRLTSPFPRHSARSSAACCALTAVDCLPPCPPVQADMVIFGSLVFHGVLPFPASPNPPPPRLLLGLRFRSAPHPTFPTPPPYGRRSDHARAPWPARSRSSPATSLHRGRCPIWHGGCVPTACTIFQQPQHVPSSNKMALIISDCGEMRPEHANGPDHLGMRARLVCGEPAPVSPATAGRLHQPQDRLDPRGLAGRPRAVGAERRRRLLHRASRPEIMKFDGMTCRACSCDLRCVCPSQIN